MPHTVTPIPTHALPWLDSFHVGDDRIDEEHRALIDSANDLCALAQRQPPANLLRGAARELIAIVEAHFVSEEALFPTIGYTERQAHVREHVAIHRALVDLMLGERDLEPQVAVATARLVLVEHIIRHDLRFKTWIQVARGH